MPVKISDLMKAQSQLEASEVTDSTSSIQQSIIQAMGNNAVRSALGAMGNIAARPALEALHKNHSALAQTSKNYYSRNQILPAFEVTNTVNRPLTINIIIHVEDEQ